MKISARLIFVSFVLTIILMNCSSSSSEESRLGNFDISPDGTRILFSYYKNGISSLYESDVTGANIKLLFGKEDSSFVNPRYSLRGNKIIFSCHKKGIWEGALNISDTDGRRREKLVSEFGIITEGIFLSEDQVVFCSANEYSSGSGLSPNNAHGFDLYSVNLNNREIKKLTNFNQYGINRLTRKDSSDLIMRIESGESESGIYRYSLRGENKLLRIVPQNATRKPDLYGHPSFSDVSGNLAFTAPYELYVMNLDSMIAKLIYHSKTTQIMTVRFVNNSIFFSQSSLDREIFRFDIDSDSLTKISFAGLE